MTTAVEDMLAAFDRLEDDLPPGEVFVVMRPDAFRRAVEDGWISAFAPRVNGARVRIDLGVGFPVPLATDWMARLPPDERPQPKPLGRQRQR